MIQITPNSDTILQLEESDIGREFIVRPLVRDYFGSDMFHVARKVIIAEEHVGMFCASDESFSEVIMCTPNIDLAYASLIWYGHMCLEDSCNEETFHDIFVNAPKYRTMGQALVAAKCNWTYHSVKDNNYYIRVNDELYLADSSNLHLCEL